MALPTTSDLRLNKKQFFDALGYEPHEGQVQVHRSTAPRRVLACGVRWGKTLCAAMEGLAAAMEPCDRSFGWVVAPSYDLADKVHREISFIATKHLRHHLIGIRETDRRILLRNLGGGISEIKAKSADNPTSLLGEGLSWVIVDEAARLRPHIWSSHLAQRLIDKEGWALLISTPKGKSWFYDMYRRGQAPNRDPKFESWNAPSWQNPHLSRALIEEERDRLPEAHFKQEFGGEFIEGAGSVFRGIRECATGEFQEPVPGARYYAGLDLAKVADFSALVIMNDDREVVFVDRFNRLDWSVQVNRIRAATERYGNPRMYTDSTGAGEPILESLRAAGCNAAPYPFTQRSKAALVDNLTLMFERREIVVPRVELWPEGVDELEAFRFTISDSGNVKSGAPSGYHDDCVVALALAAWGLRTRRTRTRSIGGLPKSVSVPIPELYR